MLDINEKLSEPHVEVPHHLFVEMAAREHGGLPLDESTRAVPPGWRPGLDWYPYRLYLEKFKLWHRVADYDETELGPIAAQRLKGGALRVALTLRVPIPQAQGGGFVTGDAALVRPTVPALVIDGVEVEPMFPSGIASLLRKLEERYGLDAQDRIAVCLDGFFDFKRGRLPLQEYLNEFEVRYEDAEARAGMVMNDVARSHLLLRGSGLSESKLDDLRLAVLGDMTRYRDLMTLMQRLARAPDRERQDHIGHAIF